MLIKLLQRPIHITAFCNEEYTFANNYAPIQRASKFVPSWWKNLPKSKWDFDKFERVNTAKSCIGMIETFKNGYVMPMWCDLALKILPDDYIRYQFSDKISQLQFHPKEQAQDFLPNHYFIKLKSPWTLKSSENLKYMFSPPTFFNSVNPPYLIPSSVNATTDKIMATHVFLLIEKQDTPIEIFLKFNTPLVHYVPITEKPIKFTTEVISVSEYNKMIYPFIGIQFNGRGLKVSKTNN